MKYLLTGGGTGGHVYPALAIAEQLALADNDAQFLYVGVRGRAEEHLVPVAGLPLRCIPGTGLPTTSSPLPLARFAVTELAGICHALMLLRRWRPHAIVGTGGYASAPVVLANALLTRCGISRIPVLLHEQNAVPGRLNRLAGRWATMVASTYPSAATYFPADRVAVSGYPVRMRITTPPTREEARQELGIEQTRLVVLVFGGSLGARSINRGIVGALPELGKHPEILVIHATGRPTRAGYDPVRDTDRAIASLPHAPNSACYRRVAYLDPVAPYLAAADLVVSRAGAGTLNELCVLRRAALLIPKANLPGDHQVRNALAFQSAGAAELLYERPVRTAEGVIDEVPPDELADRVLALLDDASRRRSLGEHAGTLATPDAARSLAETVACLARGSPAVLATTGRWPQARVATERLALLSAPALLTEVRSRVASGRPLTPEERAYLAYRTDGYLAASGWEARNGGIKLAGALRRADRADLLASFVTVRRRHARIWHVMAGLTYAENGFVRRNSLIALSEIGVWNDAVRAAAVCALRDRYFEVRSAGLSLAQALAAHVEHDAEITAAVASLANDPRFEVRAAAMSSLGEIGRGSLAVARIGEHFLDGNWKVRAAAARGLTRLVERRAVSPEDRPRIEEAIQGLLPTSTGFKPLFELKDALGGLARALKVHGDVQPPL